MVKSGEVYYDLPEEDEGYWKSASRPRNIMIPKGNGYVIAAAL
jgi:hypothetical protein